MVFNELLIKVGYCDGEYVENFFVINSVEVYDVNENFFCILLEFFYFVVFYVSYFIDLKVCEEFLL